MDLAGGRLYLRSSLAATDDTIMEDDSTRDAGPDVAQRPLAVELSNVASSSRPMQTCGSFGRLTSSMGWDDDSSDSDSQQFEATPSSWATGAFEPFEVDEPQATEVSFLKTAYNKKERECEHLRQIIKELSQSRSKAHKTKVDLEEQFAGLQKEYYRVLKVADLARTVSQQSVSRASSLKQELSAAQDQLRRTRRRAASAEKQATDLRDENAALKQKLLLMEKIALANDCRPSACAQEFLFSHSVSLY
eukprot:GHUV01004082.1.p1 GENE.GHUV01004082.1~~GHUV01004082.1.p1  ORF type:complete len:248 (+),score=67.73 GHUV01004082.1:276-1019(+)